MGAYFSQIGPFLIAALVVFIIYRRFRRSFGQQPLRRVRMQARIVILLIIGCLLLPVALRSTAFLAALMAGVAAGVALALWGAARTRFLKIDHQLYYVPHTSTGIAVSLLFLGRLVYRLMQVYTSTHAVHAAGIDSSNPAFGPAGMLQSPLTVGLFFVLAGYYVCYYSVVLWKSKRVIAEEVRSGPTPLPGELEKRA
jgi:cbb3-type cytochrome oxidase subunit 3